MEEGGETGGAESRGRHSDTCVPPELPAEHAVCWIPCLLFHCNTSNRFCTRRPPVSERAQHQTQLMRVGVLLQFTTLAVDTICEYKALLNT